MNNCELSLDWIEVCKNQNEEVKYMDEPMKVSVVQVKEKVYAKASAGDFAFSVVGKEIKALDNIGFQEMEEHYNKMTRCKIH